jgi:hypothetical protein
MVTRIPKGLSPNHNPSLVALHAGSSHTGLHVIDGSGPGVQDHAAWGASHRGEQTTPTGNPTQTKGRQMVSTTGHSSVSHMSGAAG